jgi:hypothetical protein
MRHREGMVELFWVWAIFLGRWVRAEVLWRVIARTGQLIDTLQHCQPKLHHAHLASRLYSGGPIGVA